MQNIWTIVVTAVLMFSAGVGSANLWAKAFLLWDSTSWIYDAGAVVQRLPPLERARAIRYINEGKALESQGVHWLALALQEIHKALYRYEPWHDDDTARVQNLKMMFEVWVKMPAPKDECPDRTPEGHQDCSAPQGAK